MSCPSFSELQAGLDGGSGDPKRREAERHLGECPACARLLADCQAAKARISVALRGLAAGPDEACPDIERLEALVEEHKGEPLAERDALLRHLQRCDTCREFVDGLSGWAGEPDSAFPKPAAAWLSRVESPPKTKRGWLSLGWASPVGAAAVAAFALLCVSRVMLDVHKRHPLPGTLGPVPEASLPGDRDATPTPVSKTPERPAIAVQPAPGAQTGAETAGTRSLGRSVGGPVVTLRFKTPSGIEELGLPSSQVPALYSGGEYGFRVAASTSPAWLYIFQVDSRGNISALFPNAGYHTASNPIAAARELLLPGEVGWYRLDETVGEETIYVVRTAERRAACEDLLSIASRGEAGPGAATALRQMLRSQGAASGGHPAPLVAFRFSHRGAP
jgi:hypothetical protein